MKTTEALRAVVRASGKSAIQISREIGRQPNYVSSLLHSGSVPSCETFASIAAACGASLQVVLDDEVMELDGWVVPLPDEEQP